MSDTKTKVAVAIRRLQNFEPEEGYYLAFSGGKNTQCIYLWTDGPQVMNWWLDN